MTENKSSRIEALFESYRKSLPVLAVELESTWKRLNTQWDAKLASEFDRKVHGLAGSAATFDLVEVGDVARELEHAFKPLLAMQDHDACLSTLNQLFTKLKTAIAVVSG